MQQRSINFLKMTSGVITGMDQEKASWESESEIVKQLDSIDTIFEKIEGKNQLILGTDKTGYTAVKDNLFDSITSATHKLTLKMRAYAKVNNDHLLLPLVDLSLSALSRGPEKEVIDRCEALVEKALQMITQLASYKVVEEQLNQIKQQITDYNSSLNQRATVVTNLKVSAEEIENGIASLRNIFDVLDDLIEGLIEDEGFIARYKSWRKIPDYGKGKTLKNNDKTED